jgi:hypothetical protein
MKLNLFLILLAVLLFSCLGSKIQESFDLGQDISDLGGDIGRGIGDVGRGVGDVVGGIGQGIGDVGDAIGGGVDDLGNALGGDGYSSSGSALEAGLSGDQYPVTEEELPYRRRRNHRWMLKSQIVPPVCPKCPDIRTCRQAPCPACPPCARCPEPAFTCEKVPNYRSRNDMYLPRPILADFSQFGM